VTKVTTSAPIFSTQLKPNSDWSLALTQLETFLPVNLFQLVKKNSQISTFVLDVFCQYPEISGQFLVWQQQSNDQQHQQSLAAQFNTFHLQQTDLCDEAEMMRVLRIFRRCHAAAIAVLELSDQISIETSCLKITALADVLIAAAYRWSYQNLKQKFGTPVNGNNEKQNLVILAMGKLGGQELNFSSDIDLIFFYPSSGQAAVCEASVRGRSIDNCRFFQRLSTQLIKLLDEVSADGFVYRVDMRLRPYGDSGALVCSYAQAEDYYQEQGRDWERFAMLRARAITGNELEKKLLDDIVRPFSFRRYIDYGVIDSIRNMKAMIQREVRRKGLRGNIKLGAGGIREIEFIIQSLQLIQGGRDKRLRERNTLKVLPLLVETKLLPQDAADSLAESYRFLRRVEHCIQEYAEKQSQVLPENKLEQQSLCAALNFSSWCVLVDKVEKHQRQVNFYFNQLFGEERSKVLTKEDFYQSLAEGHINAEQLLTTILPKRDQSQPLVDLAICSVFIDTLNLFLQQACVRNLTSRGMKRLKVFFPSLLKACLKTGKPEVTLRRLLKVLQSIMKRTAYLELLSENPPILQHLVDLVGSSPWVTQRLADYPILFDELLYPNSLYEPLQTGDLKAELQQSLLRIEAQDEEELMDAIRAFKQTNELRVAAALLSERLSISQVSRYLTQLAEVVLQAVVKQCWYLLKLKHGVPDSLNEEPGNIGFAVIGYGKLGGYELGFGSDLDLVFLFNRSIDEETNGNRPINSSRFYTRLAQKIIHFLSTRTNLGLLYEVDMRLRPSGSSGLLVSHIDAYQEYQMESAWTWEHQALMRARFVAGDESLNQSFALIRNKTLTKEREVKQLQIDVIDMRNKMREQLEKKQSERVDLKQAKGGLVDIEFLSQYFCLMDKVGSEHAVENIPNNTVEGLKLAVEKNLIPKEDSLTLIKHYRLFRNQLNHMTLTQDESLSELKIYQSQLKSVEIIWNNIFNQN